MINVKISSVWREMILLLFYDSCAFHSIHAHTDEQLGLSDDPIQLIHKLLIQVF
jgi:hypothetical protein